MNPANANPSSRWLAVVLLALAALYSAWFWPDAHRWPALGLFALPPLAMGIRLLRGDARGCGSGPACSRWAGSATA
jgi:hypothetical protein